MPYIVLALMLVQSAAGVVLLLRWIRGSRRGIRAISAHVLAGVLTPVCWGLFLAQDSLPAAWSAFVIMTVGNAVGDSMLIGRWRRMSKNTAGFWSDYGSAISAVFKGSMPRWVAFHALFAGAVYFATLGVCIGASVA